MRVTAALLTLLLTTALTPRAQVMVVGVAHLVARNDVYNSEFTDDPLGAKRQVEIADVVAHLARFKPTKVLIEADPAKPVYSQRYKAYRAGTYALPANEIYQFGFRLARAAGDPDIYPIDASGPSVIDEKTPNGKRMLQYLSANVKTVLGNDVAFMTLIRRQSEIEKTGTYLELLRYLNSDEAIRANASSYSVLLGAGYDVNHAGGANAAEWYGRNCYIFSNILHVTSPGDRVAVLMGQGHEYLLRDLVRLNPNLESVDPLSYLQ